MSARRGALPVAQRVLVVVACASAFAAPKTPGAFGKTSDATKGIVAGLTTLVNLQGGVKEADLAPRAKRARRERNGYVRWRQKRTAGNSRA